MIYKNKTDGDRSYIIFVYNFSPLGRDLEKMLDIKNSFLSLLENENE